MQHQPRGLDRAAFLRGAVAVAFATAPAYGAEPAGTGVPADAAFARLAAGNRRFVSGALENRSNLDERRTALAGGQSPYATVLTCSDSRTPAETISMRTSAICS